MKYSIILDGIYSIIAPVYAAERRLRKFNELNTSGALERMCTSEIHKLFGIKREA